MTTKRRRKEVYFKAITALTIVAVLGTIYSIYNSQKAEMQYLTVKGLREHSLKGLQEKNQDLKKEISQANQKIQESVSNYTGLEVIQKQLTFLLNKIEFADCSLKSIKYHKKYSNLVEIEVEVKSVIKSIPDKAVTLALLEIFETEEIKKLLQPLKNKYSMKENIISFIYYNKK
jgi:hypothetical protein